MRGISDKLRLFYVGHSKFVRARVLEKLSELDHIQVVGVSDHVGDAPSWIQVTEPDLLVLDVQRIDGDGIEFVRRVSAIEQPPVIVVPANQSDIISHKLSLRMGARYFFDKSSEFEEFLAFLKHFR